MCWVIWKRRNIYIRRCIRRKQWRLKWCHRLWRMDSCYMFCYEIAVFFSWVFVGMIYLLRFRCHVWKLSPSVIFLDGIKAGEREVQRIEFGLHRERGVKKWKWFSYSLFLECSPLSRDRSCVDITPVHHFIRYKCYWGSTELWSVFPVCSRSNASYISIDSGYHH